jgi:hypothetical protein
VCLPCGNMQLHQSCNGVMQQSSEKGSEDRVWNNSLLTIYLLPSKMSRCQWQTMC